MKNLNITLAQVNFLLGDIETNTQKVIDIAQQAKATQQADIVIFPELTLTGYPPEDLLLRPGLHQRITKALKKLQQELSDITVILGYPEKTETHLYNAIAVIQNGGLIANYRKRLLPNYNVFDEKRYFTAGEDTCVVDINGFKLGLAVCEDLWFKSPAAETASAGAQAIICLNASPFDYQKLDNRLAVLRKRTKETNLPILYSHWVLAQDELVFDGGSMALNADGSIACQGSFYQEDLIALQLQMDEKQQVSVIQQTLPNTLNAEEQMYQALVLGVRDYVEKNHFPGVLVGSSGGIDSALTLAIAVDALGNDRVEAIMMPSPYTSQMSLDDAQALADNLGIKHQQIPIDTIYQSCMSELAPIFGDLAADTTEENLQARIRGTLLMAVSNKSGKMVLSTGNKSEMAVGYSTLYGDMVGGFCALKDVFKTHVYQLARYRNQLSAVIPQRIIDRPPSAELAPDQKDEDSLPPYDLLDDILMRYVELDHSINDLINAGFDETMVRHIAQMVKRNEYKRRQAPPGVRISQRAFGRDRRYPITSGFAKGE